LIIALDSLTTRRLPIETIVLCHRSWT